MLKLNLSVRYDNDLSQILFDEFKNENQVLFFGDRRIDYCVIFENEEVKNAPYYKKSKLARMKKSDLIGLCHYHALHLNKFENKAELIDILLSIDNEQFYNDHYNQDNYSRLDYDFDIRGYCQGDFVKIKKVGSVEWCEKTYSENYLTNLFFDSPVGGKIELVELEESSSGFIGDCQENSIFEIYIDELLADQYNYSKDEIISNFEKLNLDKLSDRSAEISTKYNVFLKGYIVDYLKENLPEYPSC